MLPSTSSVGKTIKVLATETTRFKSFFFLSHSQITTIELLKKSKLKKNRKALRVNKIRMGWVCTFFF